MKRLPNNFGDALKKIEDTINFSSIRSYYDLNKAYNKADKIINESGCLVPDVDKMLNRYKNNNKVVTDLRTLCDKRNRYVYRLSIDSTQFKKTCKELAKEFSKILNKPVDSKYVKFGLKKLIKKRSTGWCGCWTIVDIDKQKGDIKSVSVFDSDDKKYLLKEVKKRIKHV